jgi:hypothetical protein
MLMWCSAVDRQPVLGDPLPAVHVWASLFATFLPVSHVGGAPNDAAKLLLVCLHGEN